MRDKLDVDTASVLGLWIGIAGFVFGAVSVFLTIYSFYSNQPSIFWLTLSGWMAAVLIAVSGGFILQRLIKLTLTATGSVENLSQKLGVAESENSRLIMISEFIASKGIKATASKRKQNPDDTKGDEHGSE